jgi:serine/threonine-protein kinase BUR1
MKRTYNDIKDDDRRSTLKRRYEDSPLSIASPAWNGGPSSSPAYRPSQSQTKSHRHFKGCSRITDYEFLDKLGEGTFG